MTLVEEAPKSFKTLILLRIWLGWLGIDYMYLGNYAIGAGKLILVLAGCCTSCISIFSSGTNLFYVSIFSQVLFLVVFFWWYASMIELFLGDIHDGSGQKVPFEFGKIY